MIITQEQLKELLGYDPKTGIFTWKITRNGKAYAGSIAGSVWWSRKRFGKEPSDDNKYISIKVYGKIYAAHRLAFLYVHGYMPKEVDHKDNHGLHNWIDNLRECTKSQNNFNKCKLRNNTSGYKGVSESQGKWRAQIHCNREYYSKRGFDTPELAFEWYKTMAVNLHGEFACF